MVYKSLLTLSACLNWANKNVHTSYRTPSIELKHQHVAKQLLLAVGSKKTFVHVRSVNNVNLFDLDVAGRKKAFDVVANYLLMVCYPCHPYLLCQDEGKRRLFQTSEIIKSNKHVQNGKYYLFWI